ncbi:MAG TPA: AAA domain-containing protein [Vicinamibacteria bacterium]|nr:AAA domain-containing protein [Vicinamibacteria bacterium]
MESVWRRIRYLAACHQADNREAAIFDLFHEDVRHRYFAGGTEVLLTGLQDAVAIPLETGLEALKSATMYKRERSLIYASFIVTGTSLTGRRLAAPLVYFPASIDRYEVSGEPVTALKIRAEDPCLNFAVLAELTGTGDGEISDVESILQKFPAPPIHESSLPDLIDLIRGSFPDVSIDPLYNYPALMSEREIESRARSQKLVCLPASAMALVPNPQSTQGVLFELSEIAALPPSPPLLSLFHATAPNVPEDPDDFRTVPAVLSNAQKKIVRSARGNNLSLVVGPPGTGKSYTVSALALDHVLRGESVLVACRTERAIDVIEKKLETILGETTPILRGGSGDYRKKLKDFLERLLDAGSGLESVAVESPVELKRRLGRSVRTLERAGQKLDERHDRELSWGRLSARSGALSFIDRLRLRYLDWRLGDAPALFGLVEAFEEAIEQRIALATELLRSTRLATIRKLLRNHRRELKRFQGAIRARTSSRQEKLFSEMDLSLLITAFPLWMCSFKELSRLAPLEPELFDIVIVDEATQSDMASPLPAFFRARRVVVTGDPRQLRHVSFLARARQRAIAEEHGLDDGEAATLDYRERSLLDRVDDALGSSDQIGFLDEHYRSLPSIIAFSNREFYDGRLRVMTARPDTERRHGVELRRVRGKRNASGQNPVEAEAVLAEIADWVERERELPSSVCHSIGVLSPLRDQVEHLSRQILKRFPLESIEKHDLLVSTPYGFQGDERDVMLLSFAVDASTHPSALRYLNQPDVFNVSITRARARQILFVSIDPSEAPAGSLLAKYLHDVARSDIVPASREATTDDAFLADVMARLESAGCRVFPTYAVAGMVVDLVVERARPLGIDLIGHPGELAPAFDRERTLMLRRAGLPVFPLPLYAWRKNPEACVEAILSRLD